MKLKGVGGKSFKVENRKKSENYINTVVCMNFPQQSKLKIKELSRQNRMLEENAYFFNIYAG